MQQPGRSLAQMEAFIPPTPVGGDRGFIEFLAQEMIYPQVALENGIEGEVWLIFNVLADGSMQELRIWRGLEPSCDAEALRLARMIQWRPGQVGDLAVNAEHSLCITFALKQYRKWLKKRHELPVEMQAIPISNSTTILPATHVARPPAPLLPKGSGNIDQWFQEHLEYPAEALRRNIEGSFKVRFVIEPSGNISNLQALDDLGGGCVQESFRLLRSIPWRPAIAHGERVRSQMEMEIHFRLP